MWGDEPTRRIRSPEVLGAAAESEDHDEFNDLFQGMIELAQVEGRVSASDFIRRAADEMQEKGVEPNDYRLELVLKHALGSREEALDRVAGLPEEEFETTYPGVVGELVDWYVAPLIEERQ